MDLSNHEFWALIHGIVLGGAFLVAFTGGLAGFYSLRPELLTAEGITDRIRRLSIGTTAMAALTWLTVIVGTWVVYPWYREEAPDSPKSQLLGNPDTKDWHEFAMEWTLHLTMRGKRYETRPALIIALVLIGLGVLGTFPTFFQLFTPD